MKPRFNFYKFSVLTLLAIMIISDLSAVNNVFPAKKLSIDFPDDGKKMTIEEKIKKYEGTFQIQVKDLRYNPNIPYNIDELIEKNRKQNETVYILLGSAVRLKILSLDEIKTNSGKKIEIISTF